MRRQATRKPTLPRRLPGEAAEVGGEPFGGSVMSVALPLQVLSNHGPKFWVIAVLVIIVVTWREASDVIGAYVAVLEAVTAASAGVAVQQRSTATALTAIGRHGPSRTI
jgi:hypothetical protein